VRSAKQSPDGGTTLLAGAFEDRLIDAKIIEAYRLSRSQKASLFMIVNIG
jgi:hypothetical protein